MAIIVFVVFWAGVIRLWIIDGPKLPVTFICLWAVGLGVSSLFSFGGYPFLAYQAILAAVLLIIERYKSAL